MPVARETRCPTCKRPYSVKLEECPFCARDRAPAAQNTEGLTPPINPASSGRTPRSDSSRDVVSEDDRSRVVTSAILFGVPVFLGAIWGIAEAMHNGRLGGEESSGLIGPSIAIAILVAPVFVVLAVRRSYGSLAEAFDVHGFNKAIGIIAGISLLSLAPTALTISGFATWLNGFSIEDRAKDVTCKVTGLRAKGELGFTLAYSCEVEGELLVGHVDVKTDPHVTEGGAVRFRAAKGRVGLWVRLSEPFPPNATLIP